MVDKLWLSEHWLGLHYYQLQLRWPNSLNDLIVVINLVLARWSNKRLNESVPKLDQYWRIISILHNLYFKFIVINCHAIFLSTTTVCPVQIRPYYAVHFINTSPNAKRPITSSPNRTVVATLICSQIWLKRQHCNRLAGVILVNCSHLANIIVI